MSQTGLNINQEWLKVLGKGMITIPKVWRDELGLQEGDVVKAKKEGNKVIIEPQQSTLAPYRLYSDSEIEEFLVEDKISNSLTQKVKKDLSNLSSK